MRARWVIAATTAIFALTGAYSPAHAQAGPAFEVSPASPNNRAGAANTLSRTPQRLSFQAALVPDIIAFAYELQPDQTEKWPQWMYDIRFDVAVTTTAPTDLPAQRRLLQTLLEQQFGLATHRISRHIPAYFLVPGPNVNLIPSQDPDAGVSDSCRGLLALQASTPCVAPRSMSDLARRLSAGMQVTVLDKTGISGSFDIDIALGVDPRLANLPRLCLKPGPCLPDYSPSLNRLGLKLEFHGDTPVESLVIDHIEKPSRIG